MEYQHPTDQTWDTIDNLHYEGITRDRLYCLRDSLDIPLPNNVLMQMLHDIMLSSSDNASPSTCRKVGVKGSPSWPPFIVPIIKHSKAAFGKYKKNPTSENKAKSKQTPKDLRSAQWQGIAQQRRSYLEDIMTACKEKSILYNQTEKRAQKPCLTSRVMQKNRLIN